MNLPILIAGILAFLAFLIHAFVGDKEYLALSPTAGTPAKSKDTWVQARSGWHWVSVDLLLSAVLLLTLATTEVISAKYEFLLVLAVYFFICGLVWLGTVILSRNENRQILVLGQWIYCFLMSGLIYFGSWAHA